MTGSVHLSRTSLENIGHDDWGLWGAAYGYESDAEEHLEKQMRRSILAAEVVNRVDALSLRYDSQI